MSVRQLEQERAEYAWKCIKTVTANRGEYKTLVSGVPAMIIGNGLGQTLAFLKAKGKAQQTQLLAHLNAWFIKKGLVPAGGDALQVIITESAERYRLLTDEAMDLLNWLKRLAVAELDDDTDAGGERK